jgi:Secretion system C-terminal sorting domain
MRHRLTLILLFLFLLLFALGDDGYSQCSTDTVGQTLQPAVLSAAQVCSPGASIGVASTSIDQQYTFLHNGQPISGYTNLPGTGPGTNPLMYAVPSGQAAAGTYQVVTSWINCAGGPVDTSNVQYWYYAGIDSLMITSLKGATVSFKWGTAQEGDTYRWALTTDSVGPPDTLHHTTDTSASAGGVVGGVKYYLYVQDSSIGCGTLFDTLSFIPDVTVVNLCPPGAVPVPTIQSATGSFTVCGGNVLLLNSSSSTGNSWFLNGAPVGSAGASLTVSQAGNYSLVITNAMGCSDTSAVQVITSDPGPPTPVLMASGSDTICIGSSVTLSSSSGTGNQWYDGNTAIPGETGDEYLVTAAGGYWVQVTDAYGCWANSAVTTISVNTDTAGESVVPSISPAGTVVTCTDTAVLLLSSPAVNYQWFWDGDAIPGENGDSLTVTMNGTYTVATGTAGCGTVGALSAPVVVIYLDQVVPTITMVGGVLVSSSTTGNQWYLNDSIIQGATHQQYTPPGPGSYTVRAETGIQAVDTSTFQIGVGGCWSQFSVPYIVTDSIYIVPQVVMYPNPVVNVLTLLNKLSGPVTVRIFNLTGQQVWMVQGMVGTVQVDASRWAKGAYFVLVIDQGTQQREKAVVLRL